MAARTYTKLIVPALLLVQQISDSFSVTSVSIPVISSRLFDQQSSSQSADPIDYTDDWPDIFPPYEQIDHVLTFVEDLKSEWNHSSPHIYLHPTYPQPTGQSSRVTGSTLVKKYGEDEDSSEDEDNSEESEEKGLKYEEVEDEESSDEDSDEEDEDSDEDSSKEEAKEDDDDPEEKSEDPEETTTTTTPAPFSLNDIKVPFSFLRIEYMIGYAFLGLMYGLGFLVLFQSICVPVAKFFVFLSYLWAMYFGIIEPITKTDAMQYIPPNK